MPRKTKIDKVDALRDGFQEMAEKLAALKQGAKQWGYPEIEGNCQIAFSAIGKCQEILDRV